MHCSVHKKDDEDDDNEEGERDDNSIPFLQK
jgi:hypothetical protein